MLNKKSVRSKIGSPPKAFCKRPNSELLPIPELEGLSETGNSSEVGPIPPIVFLRSKG